MKAEDFYRTMRLIRRFEETVITLVNTNEIAGVTHEYIGEEAVATGVCAALDPADFITSTHRGHGHVLAKGADPTAMLAELMGREIGLNHGRGGSMHVADVSIGILGANGIVGAGGPIAAGAAWATGRVAVSFFGDGGLNQGVLLESFNLAALWRLPVVFVCENNGYAVTLPVEAAVAGSVLSRAAAFDIPAESVDGMDVEEVYRAADQAVERARDGDGPSFLECRTYRYQGHHTAEALMKLDYRTDEEIARWRARDPLRIQGDRLSDQARSAIDTEIEQLIADSVQRSRQAARPDPATALDYQYADGMRSRQGVA